MPKLFEISLQAIGSDNTTVEQMESRIIQALSSIKVDDVYVREVTYNGDIEDEEDYLNDDEHIGI